jgi:hypothetical protein
MANTKVPPTPLPVPPYVAEAVSGGAWAIASCRGMSAAKLAATRPRAPSGRTLRLLIRLMGFSLEMPGAIAKGGYTPSLGVAAR